MPEQSDILSPENIKKVESKLIQLINNSNQANYGFNNDIIIYPVITLIETSRVEGGMQNITVTSLEFSLFIKQIGNNVTYNSYSKKLKGSGNNEKLAISNAINQIKTQDEQFSKFISTAKDKISKYYIANCKSIIKKAETESSKNNYEGALAILSSIPDFSETCYTEAQTKLDATFKKYQSYECAKLLNNAKSAISIQDYETAVQNLQLIDPNSSCNQDAKAMYSQIENKIEKTKEQEENMEKYRINAVKEIAKAYYGSSVGTVKYNVIVK